jgi:tRNA A-37 threonylcarbamoyl transferase component Bud32
MRFQLVRRTGHPDFLDLPWSEPLEEWQTERLVDVARGISRHVVRFVDYDGRLYALKELPQRLAEREYRLLRHLEEESIPAVEVVGVVSGRGDELDAVLITRHLEFSLPYRTLFTGRALPHLRSRLLDALAELIVRLHLAGFFWGDCSLSNALFRRDAGALAAYVVDTETSELHPELTRGQREHDLMIMEDNIAGELYDIEAETEEGGFDPDEAAAWLRASYEALWDALTGEEVFGREERNRIEERIRRLNELGYDVEEIEVVGEGDELRLRLHPQVVEAGHHARRLHSLTGLEVQENQARRLLNDIARYRAALARADEGRLPPEPVAAYRWRTEIFEKSIAAVPPELRGKREPAEIFHEILEHRWLLSERAKREISTEDAVADYVRTALPLALDERTVLTDEALGGA